MVLIISIASLFIGLTGMHYHRKYVNTPCNGEEVYLKSMNDKLISYESIVKKKQNLFVRKS